MFRRYKKIFNRHFFSRSQVIIAVSVIITIFLSISLVREVVNRHQIDEKIRQYKIDVGRLEKENDQISQFIDSWTTSRQLEKEARLKLGLRKPGENVVLILRDNNQNNNNTIDPNSEVLGGMVVENNSINIPNYKKWWLFFFKH